jgi:hypothetical protein
MALSYPAIALASFLVGLLMGLLGYGDPYILPWFMIAVAVLASVYGLSWGQVAIFVGFSSTAQSGSMSR